MSLISLKKLTIGYANKIIGADIDLEFEEQQITCLLGANGCGKTTLLKTILSILDCIEGEIIINNKPHHQWTRRELAQFIGYVPQAHNSIFPFTVEEVVLMGRTAYLNWYSSPQHNDKKIAGECLATLGVEHLKYQNYQLLSGGERQLVLIARALAQQPKFLIMDEPTSSLDFGNQIKVLEHVLKLKKEGMSILLTTHQPSHAKRVADKIVLLHNGKVMVNAEPMQALSISNLAKLYSLDQETIEHNLKFLMAD